MAIELLVRLALTNSFASHWAPDGKPACGSEISASEWRFMRNKSTVASTMCPQCLKVYRRKRKYQEGSQQTRSTVIYIIRAVGSNACKIGITDNIKRRVREMQGGSPLPLSVAWTSQVFTYAVARQIEIKTHAKFVKSRLTHPGQQEWFGLDEAQIERVKKFITQQANVLNDSQDDSNAKSGSNRIPHQDVLD